MAEPNPPAFDRTSSACKQVFSHLPLCLSPCFLPPLSLSRFPSLSSSPTKVSRGGGSFDYLRRGLIAFLNLCTDVLLHRPGARRTRPDGPLPGEKQTTPRFYLPTFSQLLTFILSFRLGCYHRHYQCIYFVCLAAYLAHCSNPGNILNRLSTCERCINFWEELQR